MEMLSLAVATCGPPLLASGALASAFYWGVGTRAVRTLRLKRRLKARYTPVNLRDSAGNVLPYVPQEPLHKTLLLELKSSGVKVLWGIPSSGKTTSVQKAIEELQNSNQIAGATIFKPAQEITDAAAWFRENLSDLRGEILKPVESIPELLPHTPKPYVIVIDEAELLAVNSNLRGLILGLAVDSVLCKSYVVLVVTANAPQAVAMIGWNGRTKIEPLGNLSSYRWSKHEVDEWISKYPVHEQAKEKLQSLLMMQGLRDFSLRGSRC